MDTQLIVGLIVGGAATFTSLLLVGVQIIFYTKHFEDEYNNKVEKIKFRLKTTIDEFILNLITSNIKELIAVSLKSNKNSKTLDNKKLLEEIGHELIEVHELDELLEATAKHNAWSEFMVDCKRLLRRIGICVIISGLVVLIFFSVTVALENIDIIAFMIISLIFLSIFLFGLISEFHNNLKDVDKTYQRLQAGLEL